MYQYNSDELIPQAFQVQASSNIRFHLIHFQENTIENLIWKDLNEEQITELLILKPQELES